VAASARGRNGFGWFFLALIISPLIGLLLVLVMPSRRSDNLSDGKIILERRPNEQPFEPDSVHTGIPYRLMHDGSVEAIMQGATVKFADHAKFSAVTGAPPLREERIAPPPPPLPDLAKIDHPAKVDLGGQPKFDWPLKIAAAGVAIAAIIFIVASMRTGPPLEKGALLQVSTQPDAATLAARMKGFQTADDYAEATHLGTSNSDEFYRQRASRSKK